MTRNEKRGRRAARVIKAEYKNDSRGLCREDVVDLMTDVMHLCRSKGFDYPGILESASNHYHEETAPDERRQS